MFRFALLVPRVGLVLKENKRYSQTVKKAFHVSHAALDIETVKTNDIVQVWVNSDSNNHLLCNLSKNNPDISLDIPFSEGEEIALFGKGTGTVHLTGYLAEDEPDFGDFGEEVSDDEEVPLVYFFPSMYSLYICMCSSTEYLLYCALPIYSGNWCRPTRSRPRRRLRTVMPMKMTTMTRRTIATSMS